jgi:hypothetical protein
MRLSTKARDIKQPSTRLCVIISTRINVPFRKLLERQSERKFDYLKKLADGASGALRASWAVLLEQAISPDGHETRSRSRF